MKNQPISAIYLSTKPHSGVDNDFFNINKTSLILSISIEKIIN